MGSSRTLKRRRQRRARAVWLARLAAQRAAGIRPASTAAIDRILRAYYEDAAMASAASSDVLRDFIRG